MKKSVIDRFYESTN